MKGGLSHVNGDAALNSFPGSRLFMYETLDSTDPAPLSSHLAYERSKNMKNRIGLLLVLIAAGLTTPGASAVVTADGPKQKVCTSLGCPDETDLECFKGKVGIQVGPVVIEGTVTCYEPVRQS